MQELLRKHPPYYLLVAHLIRQQTRKKAIPDVYKLNADTRGLHFTIFS